MNVKVQGSSPVNIELEGIEFMIHNYHDLGAVLHFTLTKQQAADLKEKLEKVLEKPVKTIVAPKYEAPAIPIIQAPLPGVEALFPSKKETFRSQPEEVWSDDIDINNLFKDLDRKGV